MNDEQTDPRIGGWPCACQKRDRRGKLTHVRVHPQTVERCGACGATRDAQNAVLNDLRAKERGTVH